MSNLSKTAWLTVLLAVSLGAVRMCAHAASRIEHIAEFYRHRDGFMGTVVVTRRGRIVFEKSYGYANVEKQLPFAQDTRFPIGSLSKQFTAAAILLLQQDGKLKTSDSIDRYIDRYYDNTPALWSTVTLRNLLTHTSGIPDFDFGRIYRDSPHRPEELLKDVWKKPLQFQPGTKFEYSNVNYMLL